MKRNLVYRTLLIAAVVLACVGGIFGLPNSWEKAKANAAQRIRLGLDLKGGTHLILQVHVEDAVKAETDQTVDRLKELLRRGEIRYDEIHHPEGTTQILVRGVPSEQSREFRGLLNDERFSTIWDYASGANSEWSLRMKQSAVRSIQDDAVKQSVETIRRRVDGKGLKEPGIQQHGRGEHEILVQLPGVDDPAEVKELMQETGMLEIKEVKDQQAYSSPERARAAKGGVLPGGSIILRSVERNGAGADSGDQWYIVSRTSVITGRDLRTAQVGRDDFGQPTVNFSIKSEGAQRFGSYTEANVGNYMAVVLDNKIYSVAEIKDRIADQGQITGGFNLDRARILAEVLKSGALPARISYLEERTVGASLGADSIRKGFFSALVGLAAIAFLMLLYYKWSGVNAVVALALNLLLVLAALAYFGAVLTLPGIAGLVLLIGMAVDSNVLIFERIREELRAGKNVPAAITTGFEKAFLTIIDTHVTTVVACVFLGLLGSGPVRGFAVTLVIGLVANVFTAVFVSRTIFMWGVHRAQEQPTISI
jgi:preprotein translocase subunit SecD